LNYSDNKNNASYETEHPHMAHKGNTFHTAAEHTCTTLHLSDYRTPYTGGAVTGTVWSRTYVTHTWAYTQ